MPYKDPEKQKLWHRTHKRKQSKERIEYIKLYAKSDNRATAIKKYNNSTKGKEMRINYSIKNKEKLREKRHKYGVSKMGKYGKYKQNSKKRKIEFLITADEFLLFWEKPCSYCGDNIETVGIDRVDNTVGYTLSNIVSCCSVCNSMKSNLEKTKFIEQCKKITNNMSM